MKQIIFAFALLFSTSSLIWAKGTIELDQIATGNMSYAQPDEMVSMRVPTLYACIDSSLKRIVCCDYTTGKVTKVLFDLETAKGEKPKQIAGYQFSANEEKILLWPYQSRIFRRSFVTEYYVVDLKRNTIRALSANGMQRDARFSPDGRSVAFGRDNNLFIARLDYGTELQVTTDGSKNSLINGVCDWVYEEEFSTTCAFDWSPDSRLLSYIKFNEKDVHSYAVPVYGADVNTLKTQKYYPSSYSFKYPSAGESNSKVSVWTYNVQSRSSKKMEVLMAEDDYIPRIRYTRNSNQLAVMLLNRSQNDFRIYFLNPRSAQGTLALSEKSETYLEPVYDAIQFNSKFFTYLSEKDGFKHLYLYGPKGGLQKQLTSGKWEVTEFLGCDTIKQVFYFQSNEKGITQRSVYSLDMKGKKKELTPEKGVNEASFNSDFSLFVHTQTDINTPPISKLIDRDGKIIRVLEDNADYRKKLASAGIGKKQFITVPTQNGQSLHGWMIQPVDFNSQKKYPIVLVQYSGPGSQSVLDQFDMDWEYYLAQEGFVVVCVDGRGTGGRGEAFCKSTYAQLGVLETQDQLATARWLKDQQWVDATRMGIWGWSYGGFITLMSMTDAAGLFKAGVAVAPVVDWRYYNTVYTERYMKTPNENGAGYDLASPLLHASMLKGRLLLIHGLADDNVRSNQSLDFAESLIKASVQFDMQVYPTSNHSILGDTYRKHLYRRMADFFKSNL